MNIHKHFKSPTLVFVHAINMVLYLSIWGLGIRLQLNKYEPTHKEQAVASLWYLFQLVVGLSEAHFLFCLFQI